MIIKSSITAMPHAKPSTLAKRLEHSRYEAQGIFDIINTSKFVVFGDIRLGVKDKDKVFAHDKRCIMCELPMVIVCLEKSIQHMDSQWHMQFYGLKDGELVLFTIDHKMPRALGGLDHIDNYQTCCRICNLKKDSFCTDPFAAARIRIRGVNG